MESFVAPLRALKEIETIEEQLKDLKGVIQISGCIDAQKPHIIYGLDSQKSGRIIITFSEQRAKELYEEYRFFDRETVYYPAKDFLFYQSDICSNELVRERIRAIKTVAEKRNATLITTFDGIMNRMTKPETLLATVKHIQVAQEVDLKKLQKQLVEMGYERSYQVESSGQFAVRGGILDVYPLTEENPYRIEFWDDEVDTIRSFDVESQRSIEDLKEIAIYPAREVILTDKARELGIKRIKSESKKVYEKLRAEMKTEEAYRVKSATEAIVESVKESLPDTNVDMYLNYFMDDTVSLLEYFDLEHTLLFLDEPIRVVEKGKVVEQEFNESMQQRLEKGYILPGQMEAMFSYKEIGRAHV